MVTMIAMRMLTLPKWIWYIHVDYCLYYDRVFFLARETRKAQWRDGTLKMMKIIASISPRGKLCQSMKISLLKYIPTWCNYLFYRAAFQYGVKMSEGRKTRRYGGGGASGKSKEKAKLDREWQQISAVSTDIEYLLLMLKNPSSDSGQA